MAEEKRFEDFRVGERFNTPSRTITDAHFLFFSGLSGDSHPIHYDEEYCKNTVFGRRVAHGLLTTSLTALGASELSAAVANSMVAFLEQSSRFLKPVFIGDTLSVEHEVAECTPQTTTGLVKLRTAVTNQRGEVVLEGWQTYLIKRRPSS